MNNDDCQRNNERTKALAYRIYLHENKPPGCAAVHWQRAEELLHRLDEIPLAPLRPNVPPDHLEVATLNSLARSEITGLALIHRQHPEEGVRFYPAAQCDLNVSLDLPATLHLLESGETFDLVRLVPGHAGEACYVMAFQ